MKIKGNFIDGKIIVEKAKDVGRLYNKSRLGNPISGNKLELDLIEGCFLIDEEKIFIKNDEENIDFEKLTKIASKKIKDFDIKYLAFKDLRKRGCIIRLFSDIKEVTFSDCKKEFFVCVFSEKKYFDFKETLDLIKIIEKRNVRLYFAVVDSEGDVTYYDVSKFDLEGFNKKEKYDKEKGFLLDNGIIVYNEKLKDSLFEKEFFGKSFGNALRISFVEAMYLSEMSILDIIDADGAKINGKILAKKAKETAPDFENIYDIYRDLKEKKFIVKTGFKFGTDFRIYARNPNEIHAEYLVQVTEKNDKIVWSEMSRVIRLAHSVNKEIVFSCVNGKKIDYIKFGRLRP